MAFFPSGKSEAAVAAVKNAKELGAVIRARRKEKALTQKQLASLCGTSERFIVELERGERAASVAKVLTVCHRLALDVAITARDGTA